MPPPPTDRTSLDLPRFRPVSWRRRLLLLALALTTALVVVWLLLQPRLRQLRAQASAHAPAPTPCAAGQTQACVGGVTTVISAPASAALPGRDTARP